LLKRLFGRLNAAHPQLVLFLLASGLLAAASGAFETTFNNYLDDTFRVTAAARGALEFPRELPGFLVALLAGALFFLPEARVGALAAAATGLGMIGLGLIGPSWPLMLTCMILWSTGMHVGMPIGSSLGMSLASAERRGRRVGQIGGVRTAATIIGCAFVWLTVDYWKQGYSLIFFFGGALALLAAVGFWRMKGIGVEGARPSLVVRKEYWLYYVLALLFGARKQLFITFGPWVLVRVFHQPASTFARLWIVAALIGIFFNPLLGRLIDRVGERTILVADALLLLLVCAGYGFADRLGLGGWEVYVLYACFIIDQLLFSVNMARHLDVQDRRAPGRHRANAVTGHHAEPRRLHVATDAGWSRVGSVRLSMGVRRRGVRGAGDAGVHEQGADSGCGSDATPRRGALTRR